MILSWEFIPMQKFCILYSGIATVVNEFILFSKELLLNLPYETQCI